MLCLLILGACSQERGGEDGTSVGVMPTTTGAASTGEDDLDTDGFDDDDDGVTYDLPPIDPDDQGDECASVTESAEVVLQPADIIFVVDNSGSMFEETAAVQANLNSFSQQIIDSGVDVHVTLLTSSSICIDAPLGSGQCPADSNPPRFSHINRTIGSTDALSALLSTQAQWLPSLRSQALKHVIVVTDDNSSLPALSFHEQFSVIEPSFADYKLHGVVSMQQCPAAATVGTVYMELGGMTGGVISDLCDQNFQPVFDLLSTAVTESSGLSCEYDIPEPPNGMSFNPAKVNVDFDDGSGVETIGYVESFADCAAVGDGWYYDNPDNPTELIACPDTCARFQAVENATIDIRFGCGTIPAG